MQTLSKLFHFLSHQALYTRKLLNLQTRISPMSPLFNLPLQHWIWKNMLSLSYVILVITLPINSENTLFYSRQKQKMLNNKIMTEDFHLTQLWEYIILCFSYNLSKTRNWRFHRTNPRWRNTVRKFLLSPDLYIQLFRGLHNNWWLVYCLSAKWNSLKSTA